MDNKDTFIKTYLNKLQTIFNLKSIDESFEIFSMAAILDRSFDEITANDWIGGTKSDGGIDGIYFEEGIGSITMHVFQCKNKSKLSQNEIEKFESDVRKVFKEGKEKPNSAGLKNKVDFYREKARLNYVNIKHYFVFNGDIADNKTANKSLYQEFHKPDEFEIWDSNNLYKQIVRLIESLNKRKEIKFTFNPIKSNITPSTDNQGLITFSIYTTTAAMFRISAIELCELLDEEKRINGTIDKIFSENIRGFLGKGNLTNAKIVETLKSTDKFYFPFLNNGISIICERIRIPQNTQLGKYVIPCVNPVIVNGLQTTFLIYQQYLENKDSISDISVTIKMCETADIELIEKITDATNTQSVITFKDKISNKKFNVYTKELFNNKGIGYISKRGEVFTQLRDNFSKTVQAESLLKLWYATFYENPFEAATQPQTVYKTIFDATVKQTHKLNAIFNGSIDSVLYGQLWLTYLIYEYSVKEINEFNDFDMKNMNEKIHILGYEYFCYMVYKILKEETNDFVEINLKQIRDTILKLLSIIDFNKIQPIYSFDIFDEILHPFIKKSKIGYSSNEYILLFKQTDTSKLKELKINTVNINS